MAFGIIQVGKHSAPLNYLASLTLTSGQDRDSIETVLETQDMENGDGNAPSRKRPTFGQLKVYNGMSSGENVWNIFLRPFPFVPSSVVRTPTRTNRRRLLHSLT